MFDEQSPFERIPEGHRSGYVGLLGIPNVGKSTLFNRLLNEELAIVTPKAQTTREQILGIVTLPERAQIILRDTPGVHTPRHALDESMSKVVTTVIKDSDLVLYMVEATAPPSNKDDYLLSLLKKDKDVPAYLIMNKMDLVEPALAEKRQSAYSQLYPFIESVSISALKGNNLDILLDRIIAYLPEGPLYYPPDQITDMDERTIAAEFIREQVLFFLSEEVPHSTAVRVEQFNRKENDVLYIMANIYVEWESQKGIVIGKGDTMLKQIGKGARKELERFFSRSVYLDLWVKVLKKWRRNPEFLKRLGYR